MIGGRKGRKGKEGMKIMAYFHISIGQDAAGAASVIRKIEIKDIRETLEEGLNDFWAMPSHAALPRSRTRSRACSPLPLIRPTRLRRFAILHDHQAEPMPRLSFFNMG